MSESFLVFVNDGYVKRSVSDCHTVWIIHAFTPQELKVFAEKGPIDAISGRCPLVFESYKESQEYLNSNNGKQEIEIWEKKGLVVLQFPVRMLKT